MKALQEVRELAANLLEEIKSEREDSMKKVQGKQPADQKIEQAGKEFVKAWHLAEKGNGGRKRLNVDIPFSHYLKLKSQLAERDMTITDWVRKEIIEFLSK